MRSALRLAEVLSYLVFHHGVRPLPINHVFSIVIDPKGFDIKSGSSLGMCPFFSCVMETVNTLSRPQVA